MKIRTEGCEERCGRGISIECQDVHRRLLRWRGDVYWKLNDILELYLQKPCRRHPDPNHSRVPSLIREPGEYEYEYEKVEEPLVGGIKK